MLLITGASGTMGGAVLREVARLGLPCRAMYRSAAEATKAPAGTQTVIADFADAGSLASALRGVDSVFLVCSPVPELVALESAMLEACRAAGVRRVVQNSALGAGEYAKSFPAWHAQVEERLRASGLTYCILRPNSFIQNLLAFYAPSIRAQGAFYGCTGPARVSHVDVRDIAACAAAALQGGEHDGQVYELNGPEALSNEELAQRMSRHTGAAVRYVNLAPEAQRAAMLQQAMPVWQVSALIELQAYYTAGKASGSDATLRRLLARRLRTVDDFLAEHTAEFTPKAART